MKTAKNSIIRLLIVLFIISLLPSFVQAEEIIRKGELLSLERCIEISLLRHPGMAAAGNAVRAGESRVEGAKSDYYPQIDWSGSYSRNSRSAGSFAGSSQQYASSLSLRQNIFDFGKTASRVKIQNFNLASASADLDDAAVQTIFNVKEAYFSLLQAERNLAVARETVEQFEQRLRQAKGFYEVGTRPKFEVTKAEVDLSNARLGRIRAENAVRTAVARLNNAMGVPDAPEYSIQDNLSFQIFEVSFEGALSLAYGNRPDLRAATARKTASEESVELAGKGFYPFLSGTAAYNWTGEKFPLEDGWNAGATLTFPVFSGFLTKHQVDEARATLKIAEANEEALRQGIFLEVQQAYLSLKEAGERVPAAELTVKQASENLELANGRYAAGVGSPLEITDAQVAYTNARNSYTEALYDYKVAVASLEKAVGIR